MATVARSSPAGLSASYGAAADKTTTLNTYVDVVALDTLLSKTTHFKFVGATQTLSVQILGSIDGGTTYPFTVEAAFDVAAAATVTKTVTTFYSNLKVQVKPKVNDTHGTLATTYARASF
jgi:hypothetical protein